MSRQALIDLFDWMRVMSQTELILYTRTEWINFCQFLCERERERDENKNCGLLIIFVYSPEIRKFLWNLVQKPLYAPSWI